LSSSSKLALVTGGAGFIGNNLARELLARRWKVRILDDFSTGRKENIGDILGRVELIRGDIRRADLCRRAVRGAQAVFHLAALPSVARSVEAPLPSNEVNVTGTLNMLEAARRAEVGAFVYSSSSSVYGDTPRLPKKESMRETPMSPYAVSKMAAEKYCSIYYDLYGLRTVSLRYFNIFGPRQDPSSDYAAVIPKFITRLLAARPPLIHGDGGQSRDFTFVKDAVQANLKAVSAKRAGGIAVNVGAGERTSLLQLAKIINSILRTDLKPVHDDPRPGDVRHSLASISLAEETIGYRPRYTLMKGLAATVKFFKANPQTKERKE
jgi:UDP-glucose 4-epimerase